MFGFFKRKENKNVQESLQEFKMPFSNLKNAISNTTEAISGKISAILNNFETVDDEMIEEIEETLIKADVGIDFACSITDSLHSQKNLHTDKVLPFIKNEFKNILENCGNTELNFSENLNIFLITGVNGAGKTTLIGKLAHFFSKLNQKVLIAAGDTFRAAAEEQLDIWAQRANVDIIRKDKADSASVVFDSIKKAQNEGYNVLLIDTAGRLQNKFNLMEELRKIKRVIDKEAPNSLSESILVLDATTGQNGLIQAEVFQEAVDITAVALTKLDGSAKGGIIVAIANKLHLPVKLIGVGEKIDDLKYFNIEDFIEALFEKN